MTVQKQIDLDALLQTSSAKEESVPLKDFLVACKTNPALSENAAAGLVRVIGEPEFRKTEGDPRLINLFGPAPIRIYPKLSHGLFGLDDEFEQIVDALRHAASGHPQSRKMILILGPHGAGKSTICQKLKDLFEEVPMRVLEYEGNTSPVFESPFGIFRGDAQRTLIDTYGVPAHRLLEPPSMWALEKIREAKGDLSKFTVKTVWPSAARGVGIARIDFGEMTEFERSVFIGRSRPTSREPRYFYDGVLNRTTQGLLELAEVMKATQTCLTSMTPALADRRYATDTGGELPYGGVVIGHSNPQDLDEHTNKGEQNQTLQKRMTVIRIPYITELTAEVDAYEYYLKQSGDRDKPVNRDALEIIARAAMVTRMKFGPDPGYVERIKLYNGGHNQSENKGPRSIRQLKRAQNDEFVLKSLGFGGISTRDMLGVIPDVLLLDPEEPGIDQLSAYRFMLEAEARFSSSLAKELLSRTDVEKACYTRCCESVDAAIKSAYVPDVVGFSAEEFGEYRGLLDAWDSKTEFKEPATGTLMPLAEVDSRMVKIEKGLEIGQRRGFRESVVLDLARMGDCTHAEALKRLKPELRRVFELSAESVDPKTGEEAMREVISFTEKKTVLLKQKHGEFVERMKNARYTDRQIRRLVEWYLAGKPKSGYIAKK